MTATTTQVYQVFIRATPEQVWEAITKPEFTSRYFYGAHVESTDGQPGAPINYKTADGHPMVNAEVLEFDPPRRLSTTWSSVWAEETAKEPASRVTWEIEPRDGGMSLLRVIHDRLEESPATAAGVSGEGWMLVLSGLKTLLETGAPLQSV